MTAQVYCAVLLCLSGCWSSTEAAPGQNFTANPGVAILANNEKCCSKGCGPQCMPPVKPGVCPRGKLEPEVCALIRFASCVNDSDCANNEKCCSNGCGLQCMTPYTANPGVCPSRTSDSGPKLCPGKPFVSCVDDSDCTNNEKCCSNGCGLQCMAPVTVKPGVCPLTNGEVIRCVRKDQELCADDSVCPKNEKCCGTACGGTRCTAPVTVKPGVCPLTNGEVIMCVMKDKELCADDSVCPKNEKCCGTACGGTRCTAPVTVNPGVCPSRTYEPGKCALIRFAPCGNDSDCANNEKCCSNGCGLQCMAPVTDYVSY